jgi:DNA-binding LacI/PurR family transcriptional regulator
VINDSALVKESTREAVRAAIARLGFRPNRAARALAGGPVQSVTVLTFNTSLYGFAAAIEGIEEETRLKHFAMGIRVVESGQEEDLRDILDGIGPATALIVIAFHPPGLAALRLAPSTLPVAAIIAAPSGNELPRRPSVWIDEFAAAKDATRYLLKLGHTTVHHLSIPDWSGETRRLSGWRSGLEEAGVPVPKPVLAGWTADRGYEAAKRLAKDPKVTAILCGNDDIALGAIRALHDAGRAVPDDVSIVGFDDVPLARFYTPSLTTVRQDFKALGKACFHVLLSVLNPAAPTAHPTLPAAELVVRESAAPPPPRARARRPATTTITPSGGGGP